jgi:uncharacterized protein (DUF2252 family)
LSASPFQRRGDVTLRRAAGDQLVKNKENIARPAARTSALTKIRNAKMSRSPHAYVRGNTVRYYEWLQGLLIPGEAAHQNEMMSPVATE